MNANVMSGTLWLLIKQMDWIAISILLGLLCASILCIAIIAAKYVAFRRNVKMLYLHKTKLGKARFLSDFVALYSNNPDTISDLILSSNVQELRYILEQKQHDTSLQHETVTPKKLLGNKDFQLLESKITEHIDQAVLDEESYLPFLSTCAVVAPLVGLFGTIWGLIHAFIDISHEKSADIATVAPGMAEALIITLAGLIVAIPALIAFHYFSNELRKIEFNLYQISEKFIIAAKQAFLKQDD